MNQRLLLSWLLAASVVGVGPAAARAEIFRLTHGGQVEGQWLNRTQARPDAYEVELLGGGQITLPADVVQEVIVQSEMQRRYEELLPKVPNTVEGHLEMAERCRKAGLKQQREFHLRRVLELDPDQADARRGLGYSRVAGQWTRADEWFEKQGYVRHGGAWRLAQEVELDTQRDRQLVAEKEWRKRLQVWRNAVVRGRNDAGEALAQLRAVDNPMAIAGLAEMLDNQEELKQLKLLYIDLLGKFNHPSAVAALLKHAMTDPDEEVRDRSIDAARINGLQQGVFYLSRLLKDKDNQVVNRAGKTLGRLGDPSAVPALIDALVTKHRYRVQPGGAPGSIGGSFSPQGGGGMQVAGKAIVIEKDLANSEVLAALVALVPPGVNFAYDKAAWKNWYATQQLNAPGTSLRRDL